jgi:prepilin-type N-terminal cleavage/methylation domain-containing protein
MKQLSKRCRKAFTLAEVLAAMVLMGIVIPVAMHGIAVISRVGVAAQRKEQAMRIAKRVLNEEALMGALQESSSSGVIEESGISYPYVLSTETWSEDPMTLVTVTVTFTVQDTDYDVSVSSLFDTSTTGSATSPTTSTP